MKVSSILLSGLLLAAVAAAPAVAGCGGAAAPATKEERVVVLDFHADWCGTCRKQQASLASLSSDPKFKSVEVVKVDFDTANEEKKKYGVTKQSTLVVLKGDREIARATGITDAEQIRALVAKAL